MEFYPGWLVGIADFLPFKYIYYWPIQFFLNKSPADNIHTLFSIISIQFIWILSLFVLYKIFWRNMIKKYCAVGG
ncbi:ABC-2 family transporter protein [Mobilitalea sibirica]|uniref:ABC-2 family transporter protein n=2 Tax=Mobilitalea sibirica TaxID=1462919 RepID=A0A8J7KXB7_9FIRM|nr:ABC-2 family transporter protein [Mobilitalea sibirica]